MKIGIDARPLQGETLYRGIGKSLEKLLRAMIPLYGATNEFIFYVDRGLPVPDIARQFPAYRTIAVASPKLGKKRYFRSFMRSYKAAKPLKKDVDIFLLYDADLGVPGGSVPVVTIFHDAIPLLFRGTEPKGHATGIRKSKNALASNVYWRKYLRTLAQYKKSSAILAISESSKRDFQKYVGGIDAQDIYVVPHGVEYKAAGGRVSGKIKKMATGQYLLYVGGIDIRKNIIGLADTFFELKADYPKLRLFTIGKEFGLNDQLKDLGWASKLEEHKEFADDVISPGFLSDADLAYMYEHAAAFLFPSRYEGFGLPVLEAFQAGCPVVAYTNSSIPEVAGDAALLIDDGAPMAPTVKKLLSDNKLRNSLVRKGHIQAKKFSYAQTAKCTFEVLQTVYNKSR